MLTNESLNEIMSKDAKIIEKAFVYTSLAYSLAEVADTIMLDVESMLRNTGAGLSRDEKKKYKNVCRAGKTFKLWLSDLARVIYKIKSSNEALENSDALYDIIMLIADRCGGDMNILSTIRAMIFNSFKSRYNYYR